jgi:3-hydroxyacyl-CoA dehydrogenase
MARVDLRIEGRVALVSFSNPPVNTLRHSVRGELVAAISSAVANPAVDAIVLAGGAEFFSAGADVTEFGRPAMSASPSLHDLIAAVEDSPKPIIAAIDGSCLGGGFELALGCHYRVAAASARFGLPEIKLGLLPGAGGTQRLPRLTGAELALRVILTGDILPAGQFAGTRALDYIVASDAVSAARRWVEAGNTKAPPRRVRDMEVTDAGMDIACDDALASLSASSPRDAAARQAVEAVRASKLPFAEGERRERAAFVELLGSPESRALRHAFFAERAAARVPGIAADTPTRRIDAAAVVGAGTMGTGIAMCLLDADIPVRLLEINPDAAARGVAQIRGTYESALKKGKVKVEQLEQRMRSLEVASSYESIASADLVIEAVFEQLAVKQAVLARLDDCMKPGAIIASNTSTLDLNVLAAGTRRPQDVIGLHFFSPAHVMRLLEIVRGRETGKDVLATALALAKRMRKVAAVAGVCDGFIGNRMIEQYMRQALFMLDEGATPRRVDEAAELFGFAMGPFRMSDLAGNDIGWAIRKRRYLEHPQMRYSRIADRLCELGRIGQKAQAGWYDYEPGDRNPRDSKAVADLLKAHRESLGVTPRELPAREIVDRLVLSLVNEGAALLEEGIAIRSSDIDVVYLHGYGFPRWRGGPMRYADELGLREVVRRMGALATNPLDDATFWRPAPLLARLAAEGGSFDESIA